MSDRKMYFGTKERMTWVNCPAIDTNLSSRRWETEGVYLNGGAYVRSSQTSHKRYELAWNLASRDDIYDIVDYAHGLYGDGLIYFLDPFAMDKNVLPQQWAVPRLANDDAPSLVLGRRPTLVDTAANNNGYPTKAAVYELRSGDEFSELWVPIPEGYTLHFGAHGNATGNAAVRVTPDGDSASDVPMLSVTQQLTNMTVAGNDYSGVTVTLFGVGNLTLAGLIAQVLPDGQTPQGTRFFSGRGHSGCRFASLPPVSGLSAALDKVSTSATLVETGSWEGDL